MPDIIRSYTRILSTSKETEVRVGKRTLPHIAQLASRQTKMRTSVFMAPNLVLFLPPHVVTARRSENISQDCRFATMQFK